MRTTRAVRTLAALAAFASAGCGGQERGEQPVPGLLKINEVMPAIQGGCRDDAGELADWIELYNTSEADVDLGGYFVSDDEAAPRRARLAAGLVVPRDGVLVLWADGQPEQGDCHLPFKLKAAGEQVLLYTPDGVLIDRIDYPATPDDHSHARLPDGSGAFAECARPSCGARNGAACGAP